MSRASCSSSKTTATTEIHTLSLHDALPIFETASLWRRENFASAVVGIPGTQVLDNFGATKEKGEPNQDRKSTRLNSSHPSISYAVFCLKKKRRRQGLAADHAEEERTE